MPGCAGSWSARASGGSGADAASGRWRSSPLGQGALAAHPPRPNTARRFRQLAGAASWRRAAPLRAAIDAIARRRGVSNTAIALAWLISHPNVVVIPGARTLEQLEQNVQAAEVGLAPEEIQALSAEAEREAA
jgi:aryl-alcohol dehydrogenase-like predicted oxidoreductase